MNMFKVGVHSLANPDPNAESPPQLQPSAPAHVLDSLPLGDYLIESYKSVFSIL